MKDSEFLEWLRTRLLHVYGENENLDYIHKLSKLISFHEKVEKGEFMVTPMLPVDPTADAEVEAYIKRRMKDWRSPPASEEVG